MPRAHADVAGDEQELQGEVVASRATVEHLYVLLADLTAGTFFRLFYSQVRGPAAPPFARLRTPNWLRRARR
jgi:hypothetical protein